MFHYVSARKICINVQVKILLCCGYVICRQETGNVDVPIYPFSEYQLTTLIMHL